MGHGAHIQPKSNFTIISILLTAMSLACLGHELRCRAPRNHCTEEEFIGTIHMQWRPKNPACRPWARRVPKLIRTFCGIRT